MDVMNVRATTAALAYLNRYRQAVAAAVLSSESELIASADVVPGIEVGRRPEQVGKLAARASKVGINRLTPAQLLGIVLVWLLLAGLPVIQQQLPPQDQALALNEYGTIGIAMAITALILQKQK